MKFTEALERHARGEGRGFRPVTSSNYEYLAFNRNGDLCWWSKDGIFLGPVRNWKSHIITQVIHELLPKNKVKGDDDGAS